MNKNNKLLKDGIASNHSHPNPEGKKDQLFEELGFVEGTFSWVTSLAGVFGSLFKGITGLFKSNPNNDNF